jgi:5-formyltetrahydrofolate cyclo-ligase
MSRDVNALKADLRKETKARLASLPQAQKELRSSQAVGLMLQQAIWQRAERVLMYAPLTGELDVWPLLSAALGAGKLVALPRYDPAKQRYVGCQVKDPDKELVLGRYGIQEPAIDCEPVALNQLDFVLVPGVAFDLHGRRLGRGKGYYDRILAEVRGLTCGVAFDEQIVREVPVGPHDSDVNCILTPTRWLEL